MTPITRFLTLLRTPMFVCAFGALLMVSSAGHLATQAPSAPNKIPLVQGLTVLTAVNTPMEGDYETLKTVETVTPDGAVKLSIEGEIPNPTDKSTEKFGVERIVHAADLRAARTYKYVFATGSESEYPGTTAIGTSTAVLDEVRTTGHAEIHVDGEVAGIAGLLGNVMSMMTSSDSNRTLGSGANASGTLALATSKPVPFSVVVNGVRTTLPAWHLRGRLAKGDQPTDVDWYILDDPANPLTLRYAIGSAKLEVVRIEFPAANDAKELERALAEDRRAVLYGIYFDFNSATIKPQSEPVLHEIVEVMKREPSWTLKVEGHTDNVGGIAKNLDLSARRAAAVKVALVALGVPEKRLKTGGYGESVPRETNATLAGRARNRRVELSRQ